jgi:hypothetical protein
LLAGLIFCLEVIGVFDIIFVFDVCLFTANY